MTTAKNWIGKFASFFSHKCVIASALSFAIGLGSCCQQETRAAAVGMQRIATGLNRPIYATHAPDDTERLFVVERDGVIKILDLATNAINPTPFLSINDVNTAGEGGLLSMAFHPDYDQNGKFYVYTTVSGGGAGVAFRSHIREYTVSGDPNVANPAHTDILVFDQPQANHNGGWIGFSPNDNYLYIMSGDGGGSNDSGTGHTPDIGNAQDITDNLLGKALRIDVDGNNGPGGTYGIPASNPFVGEVGDDEIWAYGLRNPWRASFDRITGDLWIGDVGQNAREEHNFQPASSTGGENYGWRLREGTIATPTGGVGGPRPPGNVDPLYDYTRGFGEFEGNSTLGGYRYRGPDPELQGLYFFGDTISRNIWTFDPADPYGTVQNIVADIPTDSGTLTGFVSFAEDALGNLYIIDMASNLSTQPANTGEIYRIVTDAVVPGDFDGNGIVDIDDLARWEQAFATTTGGDANQDGETDGHDFLIWQRNFGVTAQTYSPGTLTESLAVPEPTSLALIGCSTLMLLTRRRRQSTSSSKCSASSRSSSTVRRAET